MSRIYIAQTTFICSLDGKETWVHKGDTAREGHPILDRHADKFTPQRVKFEYLPPPVKRGPGRPPKK